MTQEVMPLSEDIDVTPWELPANWQWIRLDVLAEIIMGQSPPGETYNSTGEGLPFFQGKAEFGEIYPVASKWCSQPSKVAFDGDVLISVRAPVGPTNLAFEKCCIGRGLAAIRPRSIVQTKYLLYALRSLEYLISQKGTGSTFKAIGRGELSATQIPIPYPDNPARSLRVQRAIVARVEALLGELREMNEIQSTIDRDVGEVRESTLDEVFTELSRKYPPHETLGSITRVTSGGTPSRSRIDYYNGLIPWVKTGELLDGIIYETEEYITEDAILNSSAKKFPKDTLLIAMYGQGKTRGKTGLLGIEASTNQACCAVLPKPEKFNPRYLQFWFMYMCRELREQSEDRGGNQPNLNSGMIKALKPPLPDKEVQLRVIQYVESIIEEVTEMQRIQTDDHLLLEEVEQSILAQAFRGEL